MKSLLFLYCRTYKDFQKFQSNTMFLPVLQIAKIQIPAKASSSTIVNTNIKLEWQIFPQAVDASNLKTIDQHQHSSVKFLDLHIQIIYSQGFAEFVFQVNSTGKPGSAFKYLKHGSYYARHVFPTFSRMAQTQSCIDCQRILAALLSGQRNVVSSSTICVTEGTPSKLSIPASTLSNGTSNTGCCRRGPRPIKMTSSFVNIADAFSPTGTHLKHISFRVGEALTSCQRNCLRPSFPPKAFSAVQSAPQPTSIICNLNAAINPQPSTTLNP